MVDDTGLPFQHGGECREKGRQSSQRPADPSYRGGEWREKGPILTAPGRSFLQGWGMQDVNPHSTRPILPTGVGNAGRQSSQHPADPTYRGGECRTSILTAPGRSYLQGWGFLRSLPVSGG
ncbi:hypothetical protein ACOMHN_033947 [Nucella lapillus]